MPGSFLLSYHSPIMWKVIPFLSDLGHFPLTSLSLLRDTSHWHSCYHNTCPLCSIMASFSTFQKFPYLSLRAAFMLRVLQSFLSAVTLELSVLFLLIPSWVHTLRVYFLPLGAACKVLKVFCGLLVSAMLGLSFRFAYCFLLVPDSYTVLCLLTA